MLINLKEGASGKEEVKDEKEKELTIRVKGSRGAWAESTLFL